MIYPDKYITDVWTWIMEFISTNPKFYNFIILPAAVYLYKKYPAIKKNVDAAKRWATARKGRGA